MFSELFASGILAAIGWHNIAFVANQNDYWDFYYDGVFMATSDFNLSFLDMGTNLTIGGTDEKPTFAGSIKSPAVFNYAMTEDQIRALANLTRPKGVAAL
jgi:hypothetical protein